MKVDKIPQINCFRGGWVEYYKDRNTNDLYYIIKKWDEKNLTIIDSDSVKDETHLKELQSFRLA